MNDRTMAFQMLDVYVAAKELARAVHEAGVRDAELRDQATRASKSTFLGLCEGLRGFVGGEKRSFRGWSPDRALRSAGGPRSGDDDASTATRHAARGAEAETAAALVAWRSAPVAIPR
jgi:hypothetical protein